MYTKYALFETFGVRPDDTGKLFTHLIEAAGSAIHAFSPIHQARPNGYTMHHVIPFPVIVRAWARRHKGVIVVYHARQWTPNHYRMRKEDAVNFVKFHDKLLTDFMGKGDGYRYLTDEDHVALHRHILETTPHETRIEQWTEIVEQWLDGQNEA